MSRTFPPGSTLRTCPNNHQTCFPRDRPVCRAQANPVSVRDALQNADFEAVKRIIEAAGGRA